MSKSCPSQYITSQGISGDQARYPNPLNYIKWFLGFIYYNSRLLIFPMSQNIYAETYNPRQINKIITNEMIT